MQSAMTDPVSLCNCFQSIQFSERIYLKTWGLKWLRKVKYNLEIENNCVRFVFCFYMAFLGKTYYKKSY